MTLLRPFNASIDGAENELIAFRTFLQKTPWFSETQAVRLLKASPNLTCMIGTLAPGGRFAHAFKYEFRIQGVLAADLVLRVASRFVLIEFESGEPNSIFSSRRTAQLRYWSARYHAGESQIIDWDWAIHDAGRSLVLENNLGGRPNGSHYILICGRDAGFENDHEKDRFDHRRRNISVGGRHIECYTYDELALEFENTLAVLRTANP